MSGDINSAEPPSVVGSAANIELAPLSALWPVKTKIITSLLDVTDQSVGAAGGVRASKFCENVVVGDPTAITRVKATGPRLLLTFSVKVITLPHAVSAGIVNGISRLVTRPLMRLPKLAEPPPATWSVTPVADLPV